MTSQRLFALWIAFSALTLVSCNSSAPDNRPMDGQWNGRTYTSQRGKFSVTLPDGVTMSDPSNYDDQVANKEEFHYLWTITSPEGKSYLKYQSPRYAGIEHYTFGSVMSSIEKRDNTQGLYYEPWYKICRNRIEYDCVYSGQTYREIVFVHPADLLTLIYPLDKNMQNASMEQFVEQMEIATPFGECLENIEEEIAGLAILALVFVAFLSIMAASFGGIFLAILAMLVLVGAYAWLGWFITGIPALFSYCVVGFFAIIPIIAFYVAMKIR